MRHIITLLLILAATALRGATLGEWTHYVAYDSVSRIVPTNGSVYVVSASRLFAYNPSDESLCQYSSINALSDNDSIVDIAFSRQAQQLLIAYADGNMDLLSTRDGSVTNLAAIMNETTTNSKRIQDITVSGTTAYVVMSYGVVTVNMQRKELGDTYRFTTYAGASFTGAWATADSLFLVSSTTVTQYGSSVIGCALTGNMMDKSQWQGIGTERATQIRSLLTAYRQQRRVGGTDSAVRIEDTYHSCAWQAMNGGLMRLAQDDGGQWTAQWLRERKPDGPVSNNIATIKWLYNTLYCASLGWTRDGDNYDDGVVQTYAPEKGWRTFQTPDEGVTGTKYMALGDIAVDPRDTSHVMVTAKAGIYEFMNGRYLNYWNTGNSTILPLNDGTSSTYQMVLTAAYTSDGTLWALNTSTSRAIHRLQQNISQGTVSGSTWTYMPHATIDKTGNAGKFLARAKVDSRGRLWFVNTTWAAQEYYCYTPSTDVLVTYSALYNQDGGQLYITGESYLRDINIDLSGNIWLTGTKGLCYLPAADVGTATDVAYQYKVARNDGTGLADYLLATIDGTCITIDPAGRKYIGTNGNGVYVISADNETEVANYTTADSDIMSDNIRDMAIDTSTGTLYIATDRGLCSIATDAIEVPATLDKNNIRVYPNPVRPDYTGMITFEGLTVGADVKITTATGQTVHTGRTTSAMYQWDGCDLNGDRCASGVYNVLLATQDGSDGCVAKVAMVK